MIEPTIKSRPVYGTLVAAARQGPSLHRRRRGRAAILDLAKDAPDGFFAGAQIVFIPAPTGDRYVAALRGAEAGAVLRGPVHRQPRCRA